MLFIVAAVVPLIVRVATVRIPPELMVLTRSQYEADLFSYHKSWVLSLCAAIILLHSISEALITWPGFTAAKQKAMFILKDPLIILAGIYLLFVLLSAIFSPYSHTALWGMHDRREGLIVQIAYITIFLASFFSVKSGGLSSARFILVGLLFSSLIMGAIGFSQFINRDFFHTALASWLVQGHFIRYGLSPAFVMAYGTNFNPNTFGLVTAMLFPLLFAAAAIYSGTSSKTYIWRALFIVAGLLMFIGLIASRSVGGLIGAAVAVSLIVFTLIVRWLVLRQKRGISRKFFISLAAGLLVAVFFGLALRGFIYENLAFTMGRIAAIFEAPDVQFPEFSFEANSLTVTEAGQSYQLTFPLGGGVPELRSADGTVIAALVEDITPAATPGADAAPAQMFRYSYYIPGFKQIEILNQDAFYVYRQFMLTLENGHLRLIHMVTQEVLDPNEPIPSWGFEGWETWGSNRGFIFARSIPLLPQSWFIGSGPDSFILQFPQHDIISIYNYFGSLTLVDKAHNLYLQTAITTGWISAFALIGIFAYYIFSTFWSLARHSKEEESFSFWLRLGILASVSAFSVSSLATDSTVSSTPMFWIIIGIGFALNKINPL